MRGTMGVAIWRTMGLAMRVDMEVDIRRAIRRTMGVGMGFKGIAIGSMVSKDHR